MELLTFFRKNTKKWFVYSLIYLFLHAVSMSVSAEQIYFVHTDHINTPMIVTDQDQNVVWEGVRKPFGEMEEVVADIEQPIRFPGQYYDQETGLYYNMMRDYDPVIGRYLQSDPIGLDGGINTYGYAGANPIMAHDPNGEFIWLLPLLGVGVSDAALGNILGLLILNLALIYTLDSGSESDAGDSSREKSEEDECKECDPPKGTQCYEFNSGHAHKGLDPHYHVWQMNQNSSGDCFWNKKRGVKDTHATPPAGMAPCETYPSWTNR